MTNAPDLSLVPMDLVQALLARFDHAVLHGMQDHEHRGVYEHVSKWVGNTTICSGLAMDVIHEMQQWARTPDDETGEDNES